MFANVFLQFGLPSSATWFYATVVMAVALYYQFGNVLSLRNFDTLLLFLFVPGFLLLEEARASNSRDGILGAYAWLLSASGYWFFRCLMDATAVKRPRLSPNTSTASLVWLATALLIGLSINSMTAPPTVTPVGQRSAAQTGVEVSATAVLKTQDGKNSTDVIRVAVTKAMAIGCHTAVVVLLMLIGIYHFQDWSIGASAAVLYLLLPFTAYHFDQSHHVWPTAFILAAILAYRRPAVAGGLLGFAAGTAFFPIFVLPVWLQFYRNRGMGSFLHWFAMVAVASLLGTMTLLWLAGDYTMGVWQTLHLHDWLPWCVPVAESVWTGSQWLYRLPVFIVFVGFAIGTAFWPTVRDLGQLLATTSAVLISIQFWLADRGGLYTLWFAPLLILMALRPTATELQPSTNGRSGVVGWLRRKPPDSPATPPTGLAL